MPKCPPACRMGPFSTPLETNTLEFQQNLTKHKCACEEFVMNHMKITKSDI